MRRFLIDTDTASDDAVALIMALREPDIQVEAITVVAGNLPLPRAVKNALLSVEVADTYRPPVFAGMAKPLLRDLFTSEFVHGDDGMGNMDLPEPGLATEREHAVDALIRILTGAPSELELITLGPLTNIAMVCLRAPEAIRKLKRITMMGGAGFGSGNITPVAEFNVYVDAEAFSLVLQAGVPITLVGWDVSMGTTFITADDIDYLLGTGSRIAEFCVRCNQSLKDFNWQRLRKIGFDLPDPATVAAAVYPDTVLDTVDAYTYVEARSETAYGQVVMDTMHLLKRQPNATICRSLDGQRFKERLFRAII